MYRILNFSTNFQEIEHFLRVYRVMVSSLEDKVHVKFHFWVVVHSHTVFFPLPKVFHHLQNIFTWWYCFKSLGWERIAIFFDVKRSKRIFHFFSSPETNCWTFSRRLSVYFAYVVLSFTIWRIRWITNCNFFCCKKIRKVVYRCDEWQV